jgi:hypothetical protein
VAKVKVEVKAKVRPSPQPQPRPQPQPAYYGILEDALTSVSLGDGEISGNMAADIESASLGVVSVTPALRQGRALVWAVVANSTLTKALTF